MLTADDYRRSYSDAYIRALELRLRELLNRLEPTTGMTWRNALRHGTDLLEFHEQNYDQLQEAHIHARLQVKQNDGFAPESALRQLDVATLLGLVYQLVHDSPEQTD